MMFSLEMERQEDLMAIPRKDLLLAGDGGDRVGWGRYCAERNRKVLILGISEDRTG